jgi:GT2 family glycosyltransferase
MLPSVYVIILNYNHLEDLKETILSLKKQDYSNIKIIVSDNCSTDKSVEWLKNTYPEIIVLQNSKNLGWSGGNNVGINFALQNNADYTLLANNDISIEDTSVIRRMVEDLKKFQERKISILGTQVNDFYDKAKTHNTGWIIYPKTERKGNFFNVNRKKWQLELETKYNVVDSTDGCFFLVDTKLFEKIGLLKEELFMYADEIDFSLRAWMNGYASVVNTDLVIYHKLGATSVHLSPFSTYYRTRNLLILIKEHNSQLRYFLIYSKDVLKALFRNFADSGISLGGKLEIQRAIFLGVLHGILNKLGKKY